MTQLQVLEGTQVFEGTSADIVRLLQEDGFAGKTLRLIVEPAIDPGMEADRIDPDTLPPPPNTIRDRAHFDELIMAGINSPQHVMTEQDWINIDKSVEDRLARRKQA